MNSFAPTLKFDFLLANLPYIPTARIDYLEESVKDHEPHLALDGGQEGLTLIGKFLTQALNFLKPDGQILLEVDYTHSQNELAACLPLPINNSSTQATVKIIKDSFNRQRFALIQLAA
jgi:methylase of polypeptide subunit release factors